MPAPLRLTARWIADACAGRVAGGDPEAVIDAFSTDTRTLTPGSLFIALRGERFDGHEFVAAALAQGAAGALVDDPTALPNNHAGVAIVAGDTLRALQDLAAAVRTASGTRVVAVTGSAGKTTTKEIAAEFLGTNYRVFRNQGNLNNHIGLPLSLLELRHAPEIAVVELGMNHPGEIRTLVNIARPDVRVWTNVGDAHLGFFGTPDAIADAKAEVLEHASADHVLVANADDARVMQRASRFAGRVVTFGIDRAADVRADHVEDRGIEGTRARLVTARGTRDLVVPLLGRGNLANVLAAAAVALQFEIGLDAIAARASSLRPAYHRGEVIALSNGVTLIDDSYNSSPSALQRALEILSGSRGSRKAAVLGEMLELGEQAVVMHERCGESAGRLGLAWLITVGGAPAAALARAATHAGLPDAHVLHVANSSDAAEAALARIRPGDLVLVKGSRGIGTERVVQRIKEAAA